MVVALLLSACNSIISSNKNKTSVFDESSSENADNLEHVKETLVTPPFLPKFNQVDTGAPKIVEVRLVVQEKLLQVDPRCKNMGINV